MRVHSASLLILAAIILPASRAGEIVSAVGTGRPGYSGDGGPAASATLNHPFDVAYDRAGNLYLSDTFNHAVRRVDARTGVITTVAGDGRPGFSGDGGPASKARLNEPYGIVLDREGTLYFADRLNRRVRKVDGRSGVVTTIAGDGSKTFSGDGGPGVKAGLVEPNGVALDPSGAHLYIADVADHRVRLLDLAAGTISTFAGTGQGRHSGDGGPAALAGLAGARAVETAADGTVYLLERQGNTLRSITPDGGTIRTIAGTGAKGYTGDGGPALKAAFNGPKELAVDPIGNLFLVDTENHAIRKVEVGTNTLTTVAGRGRPGPGGDGGPALEAFLARPHGVAIGPDGRIAIGDTENHRIRIVKP